MDVCIWLEQKPGQFHHINFNQTLSAGKNVHTKCFGSYILNLIWLNKNSAKLTCKKHIPEEKHAIYLLWMSNISTQTWKWIHACRFFLWKWVYKDMHAWIYVLSQYSKKMLGKMLTKHSFNLTWPELNYVRRLLHALYFYLTVY